MPEQYADWVDESSARRSVEANDQIGGCRPAAPRGWSCADGTPRLRQGRRAGTEPATPVPVPPRDPRATLIGIARAVGRPAGVVRRRRLGRDPARGRRGRPPGPRRRRDHGPLLRETDRLSAGARRAGARPAGARPGQRRAVGPPGRVPRLGRRRGACRRDPRRPAARLDPPRHGTWEPLVRGARRRRRAAGALGHPQRQPAGAARPASSSSSTGERRRSGPRGSTRCSRGWSGWSSPGSTPRSPRPRRWRRWRHRGGRLAGRVRDLPRLARAHGASTSNLPTLNDFRISESRRMLVGAERRLGIVLTCDLGGSEAAPVS